MTTHHLFFSNDLYDGQLERTLGAVYAGMADLGEAFAAAAQVGKPTPDSWYDAWSARAAVAEAQAAATDQPAGRRDALLRASEYHRQSYFFLRHNLDDPRLLTAYQAHVDAFRAALPLLRWQTEQLAVPFENHELTAYFFAPDHSGAVRPTVIMPAGYDSTAEEGYAYVAAALEYGYNAVTFEGPGQGACLYRDRMFFRPDFAAVLSPVLDAVLQLPQVDPAALVLFGRSMAGYLAPQAAAHEHRIAALVCDPAQPDLAAHIPGGLIGKVAGPVGALQMKMSDDRAEFLGSRMATHGCVTLGDYLTELRTFTMIDVADQISCPTLIIECEGDFAGGNGQALADAMTAPVTLVHLTRDQGAGGHCAGLGQKVWENTVYPWIADVLSQQKSLVRS
jgi:hypothetical protein